MQPGPTTIPKVQWEKWWDCLALLLNAEGSLSSSLVILAVILLPFFQISLLTATRRWTEIFSLYTLTLLDTILTGPIMQMKLQRKWNKWQNFLLLICKCSSNSFSSLRDLSHLIWIILQFEMILLSSSVLLTFRSKKFQFNTLITV